MRVSPALLACFSLVAISGLSAQSAAASETVDDSSTLAVAVDSADAGTAQATATVSVATEDTALSPAVSDPVEPSFDQLVSGVLRPADSPLVAQALPDAPGETDNEVEIIDIPTDSGEVEVLPDTQNDAPTVEPSDSAVPPIIPSVESDESAPATDPEDSEALPVPAVPDQVPTTDDPTAPTADPSEAEAEQEPRVLVSEVDVVSTNEQRPLTTELIDAVYLAVDTTPGRTTTRSQLQEDINNVFGTGFFSNVRAEPEDTPLGVKVTFFVEPNPILTQVDVRGRQVLDDETVDEIFSDQYGDILNLRDLQDSVLDLNDWYVENGYVLAQVTTSPQISQDGVVTLIVAEGEIEDIEVRFLNDDGETVDEDGDPVRGNTRDFIITREFESQPGDVFQESAIQEDIGRAFRLGLFEDIRLSLEPGDEDARKVKLIVNVAERETGSIGASLGFNLRGDLFGQLSYNEDNLGGNNQQLRTEARVTTRGDFLFDVSLTDPWIAGDPYRTSYTANLFNRRSTSLIFDNGDIDVELENGDTPRLNRLGGGITFSRPLDNGLSLSLGTQYERVALVDEGGSVTPRDELGNLLTASDSGRDDLFTVNFGAVLDRRNNPVRPTSGSIVRLGTEQAIPLGNGSLSFNQIRGSYSQYIPLNFIGRERGGDTLAFNIQGGTTLGEIPPYEAFPLGGGNSVRGWEEGAVGSGTSFLLGTVEYRFPLFSEFLSGTLFADYGSDLGTGDSVPGDPAGVRGKPGDGFGYGAGVRVQTPLGALRLDYGLSEEGSRFHFGFGERF